MKAIALMAPAGLTNNLCAGWRLDETSGNRAPVVGSATLTDVNTVTSEASVSAALTNAAVFVAANNERLTYTGDPFCGSGDFSFTLWVKATSTPLTAFYALNTDNATQGDSIGLYLRSDMKLQGWVHTGGIPGTYNNVTNSTTLSTGTWYWVYFARSSSTLYISVNNGSQDTASGTITPPTAAHFYIGSYIADPNTYDWNGSIDEPYFWSRALTGVELTWLYNSGSGRTFPFQ